MASEEMIIQRGRVTTGEAQLFSDDVQIKWTAKGQGTTKYDDEDAEKEKDNNEQERFAGNTLAEDSVLCRLPSCIPQKKAQFLCYHWNLSKLKTD